MSLPPAGCSLFTAGIPNPLPSKPIFLYLDKNGRPVPPPNYVPNLNDCHDSGCGCGCSGAGSSGGCGCSSGAAAMNPPCDDDPGSKQLKAVNDILRSATHEFGPTRAPGWLEVWDGGNGNLLRQYAVPTVDALAPTPVFTYNSVLGGAITVWGFDWNMIFAPTITAVTSTVAVITKGTSASFTYTSKNLSGVYTAPPGALNKLQQNPNNTWTETQPDGLLLNYDTSGRLATLKRASYIWTLTYGAGSMTSGAPLSTIKDPVGRRATFVYYYPFGPSTPVLRRFVDVVGRITTFSFFSARTLVSITDPMNQRTTFTPGAFSGLISAWQTPDGAKTNYTYNGEYKLISATDPTGHIVTVAYSTNQNNYLDPNNNRTSYTYTSSGQPASVVNALGQRATLLWTSGQLTTAIDTAGNRTTLAYATMSDGRKFVSAVQTPKGDRYTWLYDANDRVKATIDPLGNRNSFLWDSNGLRRAQVDPLGNRTSYLYNSGGQLRATINSLGQRTTAMFDSTSRVKALIDPLGNRTSFAYNTLSQPGPVTSPLRCISTTLYDSQNRIRAIIDPYGNRSTRTYDAAGRLRMQIDPLNHILTTLYDSDGHARVSIDQLGNRTTMSYDAVGNLKSLKNPLGFVRTAVYDALNRVKAHIDPLGNRTTLGYDNAGNQNSTRNPLGFITTNLFDSNRRIVATIDPLLNRMTFGYDTSGRLVRTINARGYATTTLYDLSGRIHATIDALANRATFAYDAAGRRITATDQLGSVTTTVYDSAGRVHATIDALSRRTTFAYDAASNLKAIANPLGAVATTLYDCLSRRRATIDPLGNRASFSYDGASRLSSAMDANGRRTTNVYDAAGQRVATVNALGYRTTETFDAAGRRTASIDARGKRYTFQFDAANRMTVQRDPLNRRTTFNYNAASQRTLQVDARNNRVTFAFDANGRWTSKRYPDGSRVTQSFDATGNRLALADATGRYTTLYDALNRPLAVTNPVNGTITSAYDAAGRRRYMIEPTGGRFTYGYDALGRSTLLVNPQAERTTSQYDVAGRNTLQLLANGARVSMAYDAADRMLRLANLTSTGTTITSFRDTWDAANNRVARVEQDGTFVTWSYDANYQLTRERRNGANSYDTTYAYDPAGNRRFKLDNAVRTTYTYDAANQLQTYVDNTGTTTFTFDASGNQRTQQVPAGGITTNVWDFESRLSKVLLASGVRNTFLYNGDNLRVQRQDSSNMLKEIWDGLRILEEADQNNLVQAIYTLFPGVYGDVVSQRRSGVGSYFLFDPLGSTNRLTDASQNVTDSYLYKAFGEILIGGTTTNPFQFGGREGYYYEGQTALYLLSRRYFAPSRGSFLTCDPIWLTADEWNLYRYIWNNPMRVLDPSGLGPADWWCYMYAALAVASLAACYGAIVGSAGAAAPIICYCIGAFFTLCAAITACLPNSPLVNNIQKVCAGIALVVNMLCFVSGPGKMLPKPKQPTPMPPPTPTPTPPPSPPSLTMQPPVTLMPPMGILGGPPDGGPSV